MEHGSAILAGGRYVGETSSGGGKVEACASRFTVSRRLAAAIATAMLLTTLWGAIGVWHAPARRFAAALPALDGTARVEQLQYDVLQLRRWPDYEAHASLLQAKLLIVREQFAEAMEELRVADSHPDVRLRARVLAGEALYRSGQFMEAGQVWTEVVRDAPDNVDAHRWLGVAHFELGAVSEADYFLRKVAVLDAQDPRPLRVMGIIWRDVDEFEKAVVCYQECLRRDPAQPDAQFVRLDLAQSLHELRRYQEGLDVLEACSPAPEVDAMRAACLYGLTKVDEAKRLLARAIAENPNAITALTLRGRIALDEGDAAAAERFLRRSLRLGPQNRETLHSLMGAYVRLGRQDEAKEIVERIKENDVLFDDYHDLINQASRDPADAEVRYRLGLQAARLDLMDAAKHWLRASLYLEPENKQAVAALDKLNQPYQHSKAIEE